MESRDAYLKTVKTQSCENELKVRKGIIFFEARVTGCGESEFYVAIRDISSRKKAEQKLIASEERYRTLVESLPDITIRTDFEGYYLDHLIDEDQFIGKNFREILYYQQKSRKQLWSYYGKKL